MYKVCKEEQETWPDLPQGASPDTNQSCVSCAWFCKVSLTMQATDANEEELCLEKYQKKERGRAENKKWQ